MAGEIVKRFLAKIPLPDDTIEADLDALEAALNAWQSQAVAMEAECERLREKYESSLKLLNTSGKALVKKDERIARLEKTLRWYADTGPYLGSTPDGGQRARKALESK